MLLYNSKYFVINEDDYHYYSQIGGMTLGGKQAVKGMDSGHQPDADPGLKY